MATRWYCLRVISGKERKLKERIELEIKRSKWNDFIPSVVVPTEKVYKIRNGKKVILEKNILPGYILIEAEEGKLNGEIAQSIANINNVIHFLGKQVPTPMRESEVNRTLGKVDELNGFKENVIMGHLIPAGTGLPKWRRLKVDSLGSTNPETMTA